MLEKLAVPVPSVVLLSAMVGLFFLLQQIPRLIIEELPSLNISPPDVAVVPVISEIVVVLKTGNSSSFLRHERKIEIAKRIIIEK